MTFDKFLEQAIDMGVADAREDHAGQDLKLRGALAGYAACRGLTVLELSDLLAACRTARLVAREDDDKDYWWFRCYELEVEWVCNVVSVLLQRQGRPVLVHPTGAGQERATQILESNS